MSIGPTGVTGSVAGSPLAQGQGGDVQKAQQNTADQTRQTRSTEKAEQAEGVGHTEQDEHASDRDADGRRLWETAAAAEDSASDPEPDEPPADPRGKDPSGQCGQNLDLSG